MASNTILACLLLFLFWQPSQVLGTLFTYNYTVEDACNEAQDPTTLKYQCCGYVAGNPLISGIESLATQVVGFSCGVVEQLLEGLGCLTGGIFNLDGVFGFLNDFLSHIPVVDDMYNSLKECCYEDVKYVNDIQCPPLNFVYCLTKFINFNCPLSSESSDCQRLSYCVDRCNQA